MGKTILYILVGTAVAGALAVLLLLAPMTQQPTVIDESPVATSIDTPPEDTAALPTEGVEEDEAVDAMPETPIAAPPTIAIDGTIGSSEYPHQADIAGVDVYWANDTHRLFIGLVSPGTGFVSIGFDPVLQMEGANYIIASVHEGELTIRDDYGHEPLGHIDDTARGGVDNILAAAGNEWPDQTVVEFVIPLDSGDAMDKPLRPGQDVTVLVAYHSLLDSFTNRHTRRGSGSIQLDLY